MEHSGSNQDVDMMSVFFLTTKHMFSVFGPLGLTGYVRAFPFHKHQTAGPIQSIKKQRAGNFTDKTWKTSLYGFVQNGGHLFLTCISNGEMMVFTHVFISGFPRVSGGCIGSNHFGIFLGFNIPSSKLTMERSTIFYG